MLLLNKETVSLLDSDWNSVLLWPKPWFNLVEFPSRYFSICITNSKTFLGVFCYFRNSTVSKLSLTEPKLCLDI